MNDMWDDWSEAELRLWRKELQRIYLAGVLSSATINGVTMTFDNVGQLERRLVAVNSAIASKQPVAYGAGCGSDAIIQVVRLRPRKGF